MIPVLLLNVMLPTEAAFASPVPVPLFVKPGFSSVLEFELKPSRVVIGDGGSFQVERLNKSLVIRPAVEEATTNLIVYFQGQPARMFVLRSTSEEEPALYRKYGVEQSPKQVFPKTESSKKPLRSRILSARFDAKKDFLTVEASIAAPSTAKRQPDWKAVRIKSGSKEFQPKKLWAERGEIQADASIKVRFVFLKPDVARSLNGAILSIPMMGKEPALVLPLGGKR